MNRKDISAERNSEQHNFGDGYSKTKHVQDPALKEQRGQKKGPERAGTMGTVSSRVAMPKNQGPADSRQSVPSDQGPVTLTSPKMGGTYTNQQLSSSKIGSRIGTGATHTAPQNNRDRNNCSSNFSSSSQNSKNSSSKNYNSNARSKARVGSLTTRNKNASMHGQPPEPQILHQNSGPVRIGGGVGTLPLKNQTQRDQNHFSGPGTTALEAERGSTSLIYQQMGQNSMMGSQVTQLRVQQNEPGSASNVLHSQNSQVTSSSGNSRVFKSSGQGQPGVYGASTGVAGSSRFSQNSSGKAQNFSGAHGTSGIQRVRLSPKNRKPGAQEAYRPTNYGAMSKILDHRALPSSQNFGQNARGTVPSSNFSNMDIEGEEENKEQEALLRAMNRDQQKMITSLQSQETRISVIDLLAIMHAKDEYLRKTVNKKDLNFPDGYSIEQLAKDILTTSVNDESILQTPLNLHNQRTIKVDSERTRVYDIKSILSRQTDADPDYEREPVDTLGTALNSQIIQEIEKVLTFYTKRSGTTYKQGYNELLGPFLWLAHLNRKKVPMGQGGDSKIASKSGNFDKGIEAQLLSNPLTLGLQSLNLFVKNFLPTLFLDDDFVCLQSCFCLLRLLLKYHDPEISIVLSAAGVTPELYATSWFFTYFANKCERLDVICELWSRLIQDQRINNKYIFALSIALIIYNRNIILYSEKSDLPGTMTSLTFETVQQLDEVMNIANQVFENTPVSFWESDEMNALFGENSQKYYRGMTKNQKMQMHLKLEQMQCLPITVSEFFQNVYPEHVTCGNPRCFKYYQIDSLLRTNSTSPGLSHSNLNDTTKFSIEGFAQRQGQPQDLEDEDGILVASVFEAPIDIDLGIDSDREGTPPKGEVRSPGRSGQQTQNRGGAANTAYTEAGAIQSTKSPFKTLVKQQPIEADASVVPMETETNVRDDDAEQSPLQKQTNNFSALQHEYGAQFKGKAPTSAAARVKEYRQALVRKLESEGVDVTNITPVTRFPDGPAYAELCEECRFSRLSTDSQRRNQRRLLVLDCRSSMLHKETMLPRCGKIDVGDTCDRRNLVDQVRGFIDGCKDQAHICLMGLDLLEVKKDQSGPFQGGDNGQMAQEHTFNIKEFHDRVLRTIIEIFYQENFKYISFLPGGFEACHEFIEKQNYQIEIKRKEKAQGSSQSSQVDLSQSSQMPFMQFLHPHSPYNCFHCTLKEVRRTESSLSPGLSRTANTEPSFGQGRRTQTYSGPLSLRSKQQHSTLYTHSESQSQIDIIQDHHSSQRQTQRQYSGISISLAQRWSRYEGTRFMIINETLGLGDNGDNMQFQDQMNRAQQQENQSDIFTGFRHWWQDNVTNNQRLKGFVVTDQDQQSFSGSQSIVTRGMGRSPFNSGSDLKENFVDSNDINPLLQNVTEQTRAQIKNQKQRDQHFKTPQDNGQFGGYFQNELVRPQNEYQNNQHGIFFQNKTATRFAQNFSNNRDNNQSQTQQITTYSQMGANNNNQPNGRTFQQQQNKMRQGNSSMGNVLNANQMSPEKKGPNPDKYSASEDMRLNIKNYQNQTYSSSLQQSPTVRPSKFTENSQTQGMTLAHKSLLRPKAGPIGRERSTDGQPKPIGMQRQGMNSANRQTGSNVNLGGSSGHMMAKGMQNNFMVQRPTGQQRQGLTLNVRPSRDNSERAAMGGMRHEIIQNQNHVYNKQGNAKNQQVISQGERSEGEENDLAFDLGSGEGNQTIPKVKEKEEKKSTRNDNSKSKPKDKFWSNEDPSSQIPQQQKVRADLTKPNEKLNSCAVSNQPSGVSQSSMAPQQFQLEERSYYLCNGIQKQQSYFHCQEKVKKVVQVDAPGNPNDIVIYHVKRLASSHLQQAIQQQQMSQNQDGTGKKSQIFGHENKNPNITSIIITQFTTICLCQSYSIIQSRFFMHDLIKITSRKSSAKIITFYFRIPQFGEYNQNFYHALELGQMNENSPPQAKEENIILDTYNENPKIYYQFAYKRKKFQEVKMGFEFPTEDEARDCIERVSVLYKRLKNSYKN